MKHNWAITHPDDTYPGNLTVIAAKTIKVRDLLPYLVKAHRSNHRGIQFAFTKGEVLHRPILGTMRRQLESGVLVKLVVGEPEGPSTISAAAFDSFDDLARKLVAVRNAGKDVRLALDLQ